jgi:hypothetical protein
MHLPRGFSIPPPTTASVRLRSLQPSKVNQMKHLDSTDANNPCASGVPTRAVINVGFFSWKVSQGGRYPLHAVSHSVLKSLTTQFWEQRDRPSASYPMMESSCSATIAPSVREVYLIQLRKVEYLHLTELYEDMDHATKRISPLPAPKLQEQKVETAVQT